MIAQYYGTYYQSNCTRIFNRAREDFTPVTMRIDDRFWVRPKNGNVKSLDTCMVFRQKALMSLGSGCQMATVHYYSRHMFRYNNHQNYELQLLQASTSTTLASTLYLNYTAQSCCLRAISASQPYDCDHKTLPSNHNRQILVSTSHLVDSRFTVFYGIQKTKTKKSSG